MYIITILNCDTLEITLNNVGENPDEARKMFMDAINSFNDENNSYYKYESLFVNENKFAIIKKELGYIMNSKHVCKIITLQQC